MDRKIKDPVMYCLNFRDCRGDHRQYYVADRKIVNEIKRAVDRGADGMAHRMVFRGESKVWIVYSPDWEDSLEFVAGDLETAVSCAEEMGFPGLFQMYKEDGEPL